MQSRTKSLIEHFPSRASEWAAAAILFLWSMIVYTTQGSALEGQQLNLSNPIMWSAIFMALAGIRITILYINGALRRSPHFRSGLAFLSCFAWFQIVIASVNVEQLTTDLAVYPILLALDFYNAYHIAVEARITDEGFKHGPGNDYADDDRDSGVPANPH